MLYTSEGATGYSSASQSNNDNDDDASEETRIMQQDAGSISTDIKSANLCTILESDLRCATSQSKVDKARVTLADLTKYNFELVLGQENNAATLRKYLRQECLYVFMKGGLISNNNSL